jgi:hypothetical protein
MALLDRLKGILLEPKNEWPKIAAEPETVQTIYTGWIMILAAIGPLVMLVAFGALGLGVRVAIATYVNALVSTAVLALIVDVLTPSFGGSKDYVGALKLVAYSVTPLWIAHIAMILPFLGMVVLLAAAIYACYLFFLGAPVIKKCSAEKAIPFTIVVLLCAIALSYVVRLALGGITYAAALPG